jgi:hypothetical protein
VDCPQPGRAGVETLVTWYEWVRIGGQTLEREWIAPQRYELEWVDGTWYIAHNEILGALPDFNVVTPPTVAPAPVPPAAVPPSPPARPPAAVPAAPARPAAPTAACCRVCTTGKACGNSCIAARLNCRVGAGCACNGLGPGFFAIAHEGALTKQILILDTEADTTGTQCEVMAGGLPFGPGAMHIPALF